MGDVPGIAARPVEIAGLVFFEQTNDEVVAPANVGIDDLMYDEAPVGGSTGPVNPVVVEQFDTPDSWQPLASSEGVDTAVGGFEYSRGTSETGPADHGLLIELGVGTNRGVRGVIRSASDSVPAIFSTMALIANGLAIGDETVIHVFEQSVPVRIVGVVSYFPTMDPADGGFVIADAAELWKYASMSSFYSADFLAELFVGLDEPGDSQGNAAGIDRVSPMIGGVHNVKSRDELRKSSIVTPLAVAGWRGASIVTASLAVALALLGFFTFAPMRPSNDRFNHGLLMALGARRRVLVAISLVEQLVVLSIGIAAGVGAGLVMARLAVGTATQTASSRNVLPPVLFSTNWNYFVGLVVSLIAVTVAIVIFDAVSVRRVEIATTVRMPGKSG
jgi:hypothetical protein